MAVVISVRFRGGSKAYFFDPHELQVEPFQNVIVETAQGIEYARCIEGNHEVPDQSVVQPLRPVVRIATEQDDKVAANNLKREKEAFSICEKKIAAHNLDMKLVNVECSFEGNKIIFFFTAEGRVDFRELVKDLASVFRARIELRQIGVRDGAKMLGGLGICGRPLCCAQFLDEFMPVSIKMAKTQNLSLNPTKISGTCGRLMCCLKYEQYAYEEAAKKMPKNDSFVNTPDGPGNVVSIDLLREQAQVRLDSCPDCTKCFRGCEMCVLRNGKGSREGIEIPSERPARYVPPVEEDPDLQLANRMSAEWGADPEPEDTADSNAPQEEKSGAAANNRRHRRPGSRRPADKPAAGQESPRQEGKPQGERKPRQEKSRQENKPKTDRQPGRGDRPRQESRPQGERKPRPARKPENKPRQPRAEHQERAPKAEGVEKVTIRATGDTTAELKAAADRAARRQQNQNSAQQAPKTEGGEHKAHRRPRYRPRKKPGGQNSGE